jgi:dTDP-glucose 4,6-dehydratase
MKSYVADRLGHDFRYSVSSSKIEELGFKNKVLVDSGLHDTIEWYKSNLDWWNL